MISVCIPVYNFVIVDTARALLREADQWGLDVELVVFDDHSLPYFERANRELRSEARVRYLPLIENIGRSRIRNRLADYAKGEWLLFMDCDMALPQGAFLQQYDDYTRTNVDVVCGGISYGPRPDSDDSLLRWRTEMRNARHMARLRRLGLHQPLSTGNFMIRRSLYQRVRFNESLTGYGQEDQLFSLELAQTGARVVWIDNPLSHLGYEHNLDFLHKTEESILNLVRVWNANPAFHATMRRASNRLIAALTLQRLGLARPVARLFHMAKGLLRRMVLQGHRPMVFFNLYQMGYLLRALQTPNLEVLAGRVRRTAFVQSMAFKW